jgi:C1A family cysteine protease
MLKTVTHADGTTRLVHFGGYKKQFHDARDAAYAIRLQGSLTGRPASCDQRPICSPIEDQGNLGSCTANMAAALVEANENRRIAHLAHSSFVGAANPQVTVSGVSVAADGSISFTTTVKPAAAPPPPPPPTPPPTPTPTPTPKLVRASRLLEYYATRKIEGTVSEDSGATIRDAVKAMNQYGVCDETLWPYDVNKFTVNPPAAAWTAAATHKVTSYHAVTDGDLETMKTVVASGFLVGFGFQVYDAMLTAQVAKTGLLCYPKPSESLQGGHAVCLVGYDDAKVMPDGTKGSFLVRNSWGTGWGLSGYFWMSANYVGDTNQASDFWVVQSAPI